MKGNLVCLFLLLTGIFAMVSCSKSYRLTSGYQSVELFHCMDKTTGPYICFDSLITDSRCPAGLVCLWQGTALIKISFYEGSDVHKFTMSLKGYPGLGYPSDTTINGHKISFTDLQPYPGGKENNEKSRRTSAWFETSF